MSQVTLDENENFTLDEKFRNNCMDKYNKNPINSVIQNSIVAVGSTIATTNSDRLNQINHIFRNTVKKKHTKATNQGNSGRCWLFAGLNIFRHSICEALELDNFEFSATYLFFWDKFERANTYLNRFIENPELERKSKFFEYIVDDFKNDGGYWNMFANLVEKYGLIPSSAMNETWQSGDSESMNEILNNCVQSAANYIYTNKRLTQEQIMKVRIKTLEQVYNILTKFLGTPPPI